MTHRSPDEVLDSAIAQLREPLPEPVGRGLEGEVLSRIRGEEIPRRGSLSLLLPVAASLAILLLGLGVGILRGVRYERQVEERFEEVYVASIHPVIGATTQSHGHGHE